MNHHVKKAFGIVAALSLWSVGVAAEWVQTWGAAPLPPTLAQGPFPGTPAFENVTIRQVVRVSTGGSRVRLRFTNEYGTKPLVIGAARVGRVDEKGVVKAGSLQVIHFAGQPTVTIPAGAPYVSDPIDLPVANLESLSISIFLPQATGACTCHQAAMQNAFVSAAGDFTAADFVPQQTLAQRMFLSGVDVERAKAAKAVVVLGDSISDGVGSTVDANRRWPDLLATRLGAAAKADWGVVNMGISGNQVLADGAGQSALARFDRDVLSVPGVRIVVVFEGVNDLGLSYGHFEGPLAEAFKNRIPATKVTADSLIAAYRQIIARAHARGIRVLAATITPYGGAAYYAEDGEAVRQAINTWIRTSHEADGVIDFDAVMRDPAKSTQIRDGFHPGDHLHGTDAAYAAMAAAIDLSLIR